MIFNFNTLITRKTLEINFEVQQLNLSLGLSYNSIVPGGLLGYWRTRPIMLFHY